MREGDLRVVVPTLKEKAVTQVRKAVFNGFLVPGERINEQEISQKLGISRVTLREALRTLENDGLIVHYPRRGSFVASMDKNDGINIAEVRCALEVGAIRRLSLPLSQKTVGEMESLIREMERVAATRDVFALNQVDTAFHEKLVLASGNPWLYRKWEELNGPLGLWCLYVMRNEAIPFSETPRRHRDLLAVLKEEDSSKVQEAFIKHYLHVSCFWVKS